MTKIIFNFFLILLLVGCSSEPADFKGYVLSIDQKNNKLLVVSGISKDEVLEVEKIDIETLDRLKEAYWLSGENSREFKKGDYVEVWFRGDIATSFPALAEAKRIKIAKEPQD